jgi:hypothetical protein
MVLLRNGTITIWRYDSMSLRVGGRCNLLPLVKGGRSLPWKADNGLNPVSRLKQVVPNIIACGALVYLFLGFLSGTARRPLRISFLSECGILSQKDGVGPTTPECFPDRASGREVFSLGRCDS